MTDSATTERTEADAIDQATFVAYCKRVSEVLDEAIAKHGPHTGLNVCAALLGYAVYRVVKPTNFVRAVTEVGQQSVVFARDLDAADPRDQRLN